MKLEFNPMYPDIFEKGMTEKLYHQDHSKVKILGEKTLQDVPVGHYDEFYITKKYFSENFLAKPKSKKNIGIKKESALLKPKAKLFLTKLYKLGKPIGKGSRSNPKSLIMTPENLMESREYSFKFDDKIVKGTFGRKCPFLKEHVAIWKNEEIFKEMDFEDFVNKRVIPHLTQDAKKEAIQSLQKNSVLLFTDKERMTFEIDCNEKGLHFKYPYPVSWANARKESKITYREYLNGLQEDVVAQRTTVPDGMYLAILDSKSRILLCPKIPGEIQHSSLGGGEAVIAAGFVSISKGQVAHIVNYSGHYHPEPIHFLFLFDALAQKGANLRNAIPEIRNGSKSLIIDDAQKLISVEKQVLVDTLKKLSAEGEISKKNAQKLPYHRLFKLVVNAASGNKQIS